MTHYFVAPLVYLIFSPISRLLAVMSVILKIQLNKCHFQTSLMYGGVYTFPYLTSILVSGDAVSPAISDNSHTDSDAVTYMA